MQSESAIRSAETPPSELEGLGRIQQAAYRAVVGNPGWEEWTLPAIHESLRSIAASNIEAGRELRALTRPVEAIPDWRIVAPPPVDELRAHYAAAETEFGVSWGYLAAIHLVESRMGRIRGTSSAGAQGPMQFLPSTWERYGRGDINDPLDAILAAGRYLHANGAPADMDRALYRYNPSNRYVKAVKLYANLMLSDQRAYLGYYHWQVYVRTTSGDVLLEVGYGQ